MSGKVHPPQWIYALLAMIFGVLDTEIDLHELIFLITDKVIQLLEVRFLDIVGVLRITSLRQTHNTVFNIWNEVAPTSSKLQTIPSFNFNTSLKHVKISQSNIEIYNKPQINPQNPCLTFELRLPPPLTFHHLLNNTIFWYLPNISSDYQSYRDLGLHRHKPHSQTQTMFNKWAEVAFFTFWQIPSLEENISLNLIKWYQSNIKAKVWLHNQSLRLPSSSPSDNAIFWYQHFIMNLWLQINKPQTNAQNHV